MVEDLATDARFSHSPVMEAAGARSCAAVLVHWGPDNLGTLVVLDAEPRRFSAEDMDFLQSLANVLAAAMQRARQEQALRQSEEKLRQSQKIEAVGRLAGGIAHDFNNLLTAILTTVQLAIVDLPEDHPLRGDLADISRAAEKAANLTRQLLAFSRRQVLRPRVLDLGAAVTDMKKMLGRLIGEDVRLIAEVESACTVCADPGQIEQVILNLALNARDAMPQGGTLSPLSRVGFKVVEARNGEEALQRWRERSAVDLVVSDLVMPEMGGRELATRLRKDAPRLKVLFTSGYTDDAGIRQGALDGGIGFLSKPFTPEALVRKACEMLDQPS